MSTKPSKRRSTTSEKRSLHAKSTPTTFSIECSQSSTLKSSHHATSCPWKAEAWSRSGPTKSPAEAATGSLRKPPPRSLQIRLHQRASVNSQHASFQEGKGMQSSIWHLKAMKRRRRPGSIRQSSRRAGGTQARLGRWYLAEARHRRDVCGRMGIRRRSIARVEAGRRARSVVPPRRASLRGSICPRLHDPRQKLDPRLGFSYSAESGLLPTAVSRQSH